ncbi:FlhB-like protein [Rhodobium gokarnense]|uniref:FlhB-like protein n=1 Tax=Rhodobium gokarnense TaxID=364296 RepID=A0ABT3HBR7_9HYPH|nr:FlhB-like protein [Rhodobium gokarnense]
MSETEKPRLAVALEYEQGSDAAPRVTAKGRGELAEKILAAAEEHDVPVEENEPLAEALSTVELDDTIPEELYRAVAEVIGFVLRASGQLPARPAPAKSMPAQSAGAQHASGASPSSAPQMPHPPFLQSDNSSP